MVRQTSRQSSRFLSPSTGSLRLIAAVVAVIGGGAVLSATAGCGEDRGGTPPSLSGPTAIDVAERDRCGDQSPVFRLFGGADTPCSIGLIANANNNRLAIADMGRPRPVLADQERGVPSITHLKVGRRPVDVAAGPDGTAAYVLNGADGDISVVDLWRLEPTDTRLTPPGTPTSIITRDGGVDDDRLVVAVDDPDGLWFHDGVDCRESAGDEAACQGLDADGTLIPTPGGVADMSVSADGNRLYTVYRDRDWMSVWALPGESSLEDRDVACRNGAASAPCEVSRVGLRWECADGLDNDGDGAADQEDEQCYGPKDAESPGGVGRSPGGVCADGEDNDGDGLVDRADPECLLGIGDSEEEPIVEDPAETVCSDGVDNDGDGEADWPDDPGCYGPDGRTEEEVDVQGFDQVDVGMMDQYVYVTSRGDAEVLVVDVEQGDLIDAGAVETPAREAFTDDLGVSVAEWPAVLEGVVRRRVMWTDSDNPAHGIVQYLYGAWAAADDGQAYFVHTATSYCEVTEPDRASLLDRTEFQVGSEAFEQSRERHCVTTPALPIEFDRSTDACNAVDDCRACRNGEDGGFDPMCDSACEGYRDNLQACRTQGRRLEPTEDVQVAFNPRMSLRDARSEDARVVGSGQCEEPEAFLDDLRAFVSENPDASDDLSCVSPLRPQPLDSQTSRTALEGSDFDDVERAHLLERPEVVLAAEDGDVSSAVVSRPWDSRIRSESWAVTWEGVLPNTRRGDGLLGDEEAGRLHVGGMDPCANGVREGDRLSISTDPKSGDEAPDRCEAFTNRQERGTWRTWRIASVRPGVVELETIEESGDDDIYADELPDRECFPQGIEYEIRPHDDWTVVGDQSGYVSDRRAAFGACVPRPEARRRNARVDTGRLFAGPYLEFVLYDGNVDPLRRPAEELSYEFEVRRFFTPERIGFAPDSVRNDGVLPSTVLFNPAAPGGRRLLIGDASNDFIYVRNLDRGGEEAISLLR